MKRDLEIAREIQSWLVPSNPPEVLNGDIAFATCPQNSVAGDYYDAFYANPEASGGGKLMLVIADVAGKSVPAALLMATFQASLRTIAGDGAPLAALVARLNRYSCAHSLDGLRFTTAVLAEYDPVSYTHLDVYKRQGFAPSTSSVLVLTVSPEQVTYTISASSTPYALAQGGSVNIPITVPPIGGAYNAVVTLSAVSYTHLDVYKRQIYEYLSAVPCVEGPTDPTDPLHNDCP